MKKSGLVVGLLLLGSQPTAQTISWGPVTAVPLSSTSLMIMTGLFLFLGTWMLFKKQAQLLSVALLALSVGSSYYTLHASVPAVSITTDSGSEELYMNATTTVTNDGSNNIKITAIDPDTEISSCTIESSSTTCSVGLVLAPSDSCNVTLDCPSIPD
jgi:hypothetical protein